MATLPVRPPGTSSPVRWPSLHPDRRRYRRPTSADRCEATVRKFWGALAVQLGKRAGLVSIAGLLITVGLGLGITQLKFATGQDSYLNKGDQVYKDNVQYQGLFGG